MKLFELTHGVTIMPDQVSSLITAENGSGITVHLKNGEAYWVDKDYGKTDYETHRRLVKEINEAMQ